MIKNIDHGNDQLFNLDATNQILKIGHPLIFLECAISLEDFPNSSKFIRS